MIQKNYYTTTALVATLVLGFPQFALAQSATSGVNILPCSDETEPACAEGKPADASRAHTELDGDASANADAAAGKENGAAVTGNAGAEVEMNASGSAAASDVDVGAGASAGTGAGNSVFEQSATDASDIETVTNPVTTETDADAMVETDDEVTSDVAADAETSSAATADASAEVETNASGTAVGASTDAEPTEVTEGTIGTGNARTSSQEFNTQIDGSAAVAGEETGVSAGTTSTTEGGMGRFDEALMLGLGAIAVGSLLNDGSEVVANTGDRVVVNRNGQLVLYKDDNALLFREGENVRTETFSDGSTRTSVSRADGGQIVTIRDGEGRVLRRTQIASDGTEVQLFDDTIQAEAIDATQLANYVRVDSVLSSNADQAALRMAMQSETNPDRRFSLRQIREHEEVRNLVPSIELDTINFATGSSALRQGEIENLRSVGATMEEILSATPREVFMIEGHTDAVGDAVSNLALSDRRAETIALALTENFSIAPENLLVQGYGEQFLKIETQDAELANRRATVRRITPLLQHTAAE